MGTVRELISSSLRLLGVLGEGETASAEQASEGLSALNLMIGGWSTNNLFIYARTREAFSLVANQSSYTMGPSGNFNTTRPARIDYATVRISGDTPFEHPVGILTVKEWANMSQKTATSDIPTKIFIQGTYPLQTVNVWPVPTAAYELVFYTLKPLSRFTAISETISLPDGYERALKFNLAVELASEYGREPSTLVMLNASESKADIKRANITESVMECDSSVLEKRGTFNIITGE